MKKIILIGILGAFIIACNKDKKNTKEEIIEKPIEKVFDDSEYVLDDSYPMGDARRYGVTAADARKSHPTSGKNRMTTALDIAEMSGMEISFPSGYYGMNLTLDNRKNLKLRFNKSEFDLIHITQGEKENPIPENMTLKGTLISYDRLGITEAKNITIDSVILKSDTNKNLRQTRNRGCHIYHGCKNIKINYLEIDDLGSESDQQTHTHAALSIDGYGNNPENVQIKKVHIKSTDRHGIYMTGSDHFIGEVIIDKFGMGSSKGMSGMQDADNENNENKEFKALWINKCYNSFIEKITINEKASKGKYTVHFDAGDKERPVTIGSINIVNDNPNISILEEEGSGVIIEE